MFMKLNDRLREVRQICDSSRSGGNKVIILLPLDVDAKLTGSYAISLIRNIPQSTRYSRACSSKALPIWHNQYNSFESVRLRKRPNMIQITLSHLAHAHSVIDIHVL